MAGRRFSKSCMRKKRACLFCSHPGRAAICLAPACCPAALTGRPPTSRPCWDVAEPRCCLLQIPAAASPRDTPLLILIAVTASSTGSAAGLLPAPPQSLLQGPDPGGPSFLPAAKCFRRYKLVGFFAIAFGPCTCGLTPATPDL